MTGCPHRLHRDPWISRCLSVSHSPRSPLPPHRGGARYGLSGRRTSGVPRLGDEDRVLRWQRTVVDRWRMLDPAVTSECRPGAVCSGTGPPAPQIPHKPHLHGDIIHQGRRETWLDRAPRTRRSFRPSPSAQGPYVVLIEPLPLAEHPQLDVCPPSVAILTPGGEHPADPDAAAAGLDGLG